MLIALAADPRTTAAQARAAERSYCVSFGALNTLLESLVDLPDDLRSGDHSLVSYYAGPAEAAERMGEIAAAARADADRLAHADRHAVILAGMVGFYLSCATRRGSRMPTPPPAARSPRSARRPPR